MRILHFAILCLSIHLISGSLHAQIGSLQFIENKGQWHNKIKFKQDLKAGAFFLTGTGFSVLQHNPDDLKMLSAYFQGEAPVKSPNNEKEMKLHSHSYEVSFVNALVPTILPSKVLSSYNNYFIGNDPSKWAGNCKIYQAVTYKNIYPNIDVSYYTSNGSLKYDFIIHPGGNVSSIRMRYDGMDALNIVNEELIIKTSVSEVKEMAPYAYEEGGGSRVECKFKIEGNTVRFETGSYGIGKTLIVDPTLVFSTYTGSTADNWGQAATYGPDGSAFAAGVVFDNGYPVNTGAFETVYQGGTIDEEQIFGWDIGIIKFSPNGSNRIYATYLGGDNNESPLSLIADSFGNLIVAGRTRSTNYPTTLPTVGVGGNYDLFITKLNGSGNGLIGSRKMGGSGMDGVNIRLKFANPTGSESLRRNYGDDMRSMVILDTSENIILSSQTMSGDFPVSAGSFQTVFGGQQDGVIIKTSPDLSSIIFSSFIGGSANDAAFAVAINPTNNNLYIAGNTQSINLPGDRTGVLQSTFQGNTDGFISIVTNNGASILKTSYVGTAGFDIIYNIQIDTTGFPYITGTSTGSWPVLNAAFNQPGGKQFIAKLQPTLSAFVYSTVFGTNTNFPNIASTAFFVDACENIYVSGWGGALSANLAYENSGTAGLLTTPDAIKTITDSSDFYILVLQKNAAAVLYASFFGAQGGIGDHVDGGTSNFDKNAVLYQAACHCESPSSSSFPTTLGSWSPASGSISCNQAVFKLAFDFCSAPIPLHIVDFKGRVLNVFHELEWQVANEEAGDRYILQKRTGVNDPFLDVYTTSTSSDRISHTYKTQLPAGNFLRTYYRLKTVSFNGRIGYSPVILLTSKPGKEITAYVIQNRLNVNLPDDALSIKLFTIDGKLLKQVKTVSNFASIDLDNISRGVLVIKVQLKHQEIIQKILY